MSGAAVFSSFMNLWSDEIDRRHERRLQDRQNMFNSRQSELDRAMQYEFARNGLSWRVADAKAAGLHPLAALGSQINSASPSGIPGQFGGGSAKSDGMRAAAQQISQIMAEKEETQSRTELNRAQADLLKQQAEDSKMARAVQLSNAVQDGDAVHKLVEPQRTPKLMVGGVPIKTFPGGSDAQTFEDRYGELGGSVLGLTNIPADALFSIYKLLQRLGDGFNRGTYEPETVFNVK